MVLGSVLFGYQPCLKYLLCSEDKEFVQGWYDMRVSWNSSSSLFLRQSGCFLHVFLWLIRARVKSRAHRIHTHAINSAWKNYQTNKERTRRNRKRERMCLDGQAFELLADSSGSFEATFKVCDYPQCPVIENQTGSAQQRRTGIIMCKC